MFELRELYKAGDSAPGGEGVFGREPTILRRKETVAVVRDRPARPGGIGMIKERLVLKD